jgi:peroxiredoxin
MARCDPSLPVAFYSPTIVIFYRGGWCPYCNMQLSDLRLVVSGAELREQGFEIVFLSTDPAPIPRTSDSCSFYAALKVRG